jgi:hypothetical protein
MRILHVCNSSHIKFSENIDLSKSTPSFPLVAESTTLLGSFTLCIIDNASFGDSNILLVTAHPDDECMFFGPVLCNLTSKSLKNQVHVLCLSKGNETNIKLRKWLDMRSHAYNVQLINQR